MPARFKERLTQFYKQYNPACLDSIDEILDIFHGRENELFSVLEEKYAGVPARQQPMLATPSPTPERARFFSSVKTDLPVAAEGQQRRVTVTQSSATAGPSAVAAISHEQSIVQHHKQAEEELLALSEENRKLRSVCHNLQCELVVAQAEKEALSRQRRNDESTIERLRSHIATHDHAERDLIDRLSVCELSGKGPLAKEEFAAIITSSQERLTRYYEDKIAFMQTEMEDFYRHAAERIKEKDAVIAALKQDSFLSH